MVPKRLLISRKKDGLQAQPNTKVDFVDPDVREAFKEAYSR